MSAETLVSKIARIALRLFLIGNLICAIGFGVSIILSIPFAHAISARLIHKYGPGIDVPEILLASRLLFALGIVAAVALYRVLASLLDILGTVTLGDPFTTANAGRLRTIGWALLVLQLLDLALGAFTAWFGELHVEFVSWDPSLGGWIAVLMAFVLADVFSRGAAMRDDLAMTV